MKKPIVRRKFRRQEPESTRDLILQEAMRFIVRDGVQELRLKDIADAIGIRAPSIYKHFPNRESIVAALALRMIEEEGEQLKPDPNLPAPQWLSAWARGLVWFFATRPAYVRIMLNDLAVPEGLTQLLAHLGPVERTAQLPQIIAFTDPFRQKYQQSVDAGIFAPIDYSQFFAAIFGAVTVGLVWPYAERRGEITSRELDQLQSLAETLALAVAQKGLRPKQ